MLDYVDDCELTTSNGKEEDADDSMLITINGVYENMSIIVCLPQKMEKKVPMTLCSVLDYVDDRMLTASNGEE
jgi:hypothetical protein